MTDELSSQSEDESGWGSKLFNWVFFPMFIIGTLIMIPWAFMPIAKSIDARNWIETPAIIQTSYVDGRENQYMVFAEYSYSVDGQDFSSDRVFFDDVKGIRRNYYHQIDRELSKHKLASNPMMVWVNPDNPQTAVIYRHISWDKFLFRLFWTSIMAFFAFGPLWVWYEQRRDAGNTRNESFEKF